MVRHKAKIITLVLCVAVVAALGWTVFSVHSNSKRPLHLDLRNPTAISREDASCENCDVTLVLFSGERITCHARHAGADVSFGKVSVFIRAHTTSATAAAEWIDHVFRQTSTHGLSSPTGSQNRLRQLREAPPNSMLGPAFIIDSVTDKDGIISIGVTRVGGGQWAPFIDIAIE